VQVETVEIIRRHLNAMLDELSNLGSVEMIGEDMTSLMQQPQKARAYSLPATWHHVRSLDGETYSWPKTLEEYRTFDVYEGRSPNGTLSRWAIGECERTSVWGRDRKYFIVFRLGAGDGSKQPICEYLETDDYDQTREFVAIVRGAGGPRGQRMFNPGDPLPSYYDGMRVETYRDRVPGTPEFRGWNKLAVVAQEDDREAMLRHAAIQVLLRHS